MNAINNNFINAIGWTIIHSLWQGVLIYLVLCLLFIALPKMTARTKHHLAFTVLLLLFALCCSTFFMLFKLPSNNALTADSNLSQFNYLDLHQFYNNNNFKIADYLPVIVIVYIVGISLQFTVLVSSYFKLKKLKQANTIAIPAEWKVIFEMTLFQLKINKKIKFFLSEKVGVPLVIGFLKPVVLFPISLITQLDAKQVEAILIHELSHIRRNDYLINLIKTVIETLLFFNPFVWLITKFINIEREHACDDMVIKFTGTPLTYAHALLKLELFKKKTTPALSLAAIGNHQYLYQRIKRITNMKTNYINAKQLVFILTLTIATIASIAWIKPSNKQEISAKYSNALIIKKISAMDKKAIHLKLVGRADTDTVINKRNPKHQYIMQVNGKSVTYTSIDEMPDSLKRKILAMEKKFNSPEWKDKMAKIELNAKAMEKKFNSPEWKEQLAKIELNAKAMDKKFNSPEWKEQLAKIELNAKAMDKKFNSPEWKEKMEMIQKNAGEMQKKYNSPEWKKQIEDLKKLQESPEYKELKKKYESDVEELKEKKGFGNKLAQSILPIAFPYAILSEANIEKYKVSIIY